VVESLCAFRAPLPLGHHQQVGIIVTIIGKNILRKIEFFVFKHQSVALIDLAGILYLALNFFGQSHKHSCHGTMLHLESIFLYLGQKVRTQSYDM
jgi:hypothetical protein